MLLKSLVFNLGSEDWLRSWVPSEWFERYGRPIEEYPLRRGRGKGKNLALASSEIILEYYSVKDIVIFGES